MSVRLCCVGLCWVVQGCDRDGLAGLGTNAPWRKVWGVDAFLRIVLFCPVTVLSCPVMSCPIPPCPMLPCSILSCRVGWAQRWAGKLGNDHFFCRRAGSGCIFAHRVGLVYVYVASIAAGTH